jgi:beta-xylosidase
MKQNLIFTILSFLVYGLGFSQENLKMNNPITDGWYAGPKAAIFDDTYWVYPTFSDDYGKQLYFDAFSSKNLVDWKNHERILDTTKIKWLRQALWAPSIIAKNQKYFLFFGANDIQRPSRNSYDPNNDINHYGGIEVAVADTPAGPFSNHLGEPLISDFYNDAQPIDQFVFKDVDDTYYFFYGGWSHCNLGILNDSFTGFMPWEDGTNFKEITPEGYWKGPLCFYETESTILCGRKVDGPMERIKWLILWQKRPLNHINGLALYSNPRRGTLLPEQGIIL